jgi:predicted ATP-grasp superfamily ATP-dependent carboligase
MDRPDAVPLLIVGASARAAAQSALRAGFQPLCVDAYADRDLRETCPVCPWPPCTRELVELVASLPTRSWIYTGGLENRPGLVGRLSRRLPLWGNADSVLRRARDPLTLHRLLGEADLPVLPVRRADQPPPGDGRWLIKPCRGSGGRAIMVWRGTTSALPKEPYYFQQLAEGVDISALYLAQGEQVQWIGSTRQWSGQTGGVTSPHAWHGNLVGEPLTDQVTTLMQRVGQVLVAGLGLRGLFGCDFRLAGSIPWLLEINPRYTGSVELFEWALRRPLLREHAVACGIPEAELSPSPRELDPPGSINQLYAKRIVYSTRAGEAHFPDVLPCWAGGFTPSPLADIPMGGQLLRPGDPICSIFASGSTSAELDRQIHDWLSRISSWIRPT